jgi:hypothetical protein
MAMPNSRSTFKDYCLRKLGFPVVEMNLDDDQIEDRIDEALDLFRTFNFDSMEKTYLKHQVTAGDIANNYISVSDDVIGINKIFTLSATQVGPGGSLSFNMFDLTYQLRLNELYDFTSADYVYFSLANQHLRTMEMLFIGEVPIRFNKHAGKLYLDSPWNRKLTTGQYFIAECYVVVPESNTKLWNDVWLKRYTTALIKQQWGTNLKKYSGMQLPGGITFNGQQIYDEATEAISHLEAQMISDYSMPVLDMIA